MSGGRWGYCGALIRDGLEAMGEEEEIEERFPDLAKILTELGDMLYKLEHNLDYDLSSDSHIKDDREFEHQTIGKLLDVVLKSSPDEWFPRGKWATIQAFQARSGSEKWGE